MDEDTIPDHVNPQHAHVPLQVLACFIVLLQLNNVQSHAINHQPSISAPSNPIHQ
jgi:hypothetical protein